MRKSLGSLSNFIYRHAKLTILLVLLIAGVIGSIALYQGPNFSDAGLEMKGTESQTALNIVKKDFSSVSSKNATEKVVFRAKSGKLTNADKDYAINQFVQKVMQDKDVKVVMTPAQQKNMVKKNTIGYATIVYKQKKANLKQSSVSHALTAVKKTRTAGIQTELTGDLTINQMDTGERSEVYGLIAAIVILAITFSSFAIAGLPILSAIIGLAVSVLGIIILSHHITFVSSDLSLSGMIGLAVGIDYALFIISRYQQEFKKGLSRKNALAKSMTTAGKSVVFAGLTVIVALLAMSVLGISFLSVMGIAGAISVLFALLTSLTFVPAMIILLGAFATGEKPNRFLKVFSKANKNYGWGKFVYKYKFLLAIASVGLLIVTAIPFSHINLGLPTDGNKSTKFTERRAYDLMKEGYGDGNSATLVVLVHTNNQAKAISAYNEIKSNKNVSSTTPPMSGNGKSGNYFMLTVTPKTDGNNIATKKLVNKIRSQSEKSGIPKLLVTGSTAINIDMSDALMKALPKFAAIIIVFAFLLLMVVFRSLMIPTVAVGGFVLSLLATLGALTFIVQDGHMQNLLGLTGKSAILNFAPVLVIGILFGLAMDYEVFLVSRIREVYNQTKDNKKAVLEGLKSSGKAVFAAALIMTAVFMGFVFAGDSTVKSIGIVLTLGILFDAFIVRMILVPAMIAIFENKNWYLPKWLDKILPHIDVE
ncbi:MMPL family transporter [Lactiplantibacillus paraplantarum]|uniref:MMPL family transporter n=1 Tax=Lactiplantibacillus paraplantarum TaxID=60520 RepID=UPI0021A86901|nr:MMPL family transporter [Lactiplantibacillus paraplantarum]MCT4456229.1 MMPL family transporter [Lactiplantibacillus paraplantarum]